MYIVLKKHLISTWNKFVKQKKKIREKKCLKVRGETCGTWKGIDGGESKRDPLIRLCAGGKWGGKNGGAAASGYTPLARKKKKEKKRNGRKTRRGGLNERGERERERVHTVALLLYTRAYSATGHFLIRRDTRACRVFECESARK